MKICWDNIENIQLIKKDVFRDIVTKKRYWLMEECKTCSYPFFSTTKNSISYCDNKCQGSHKSRFKIKYENLLSLFNNEGYKVLTTADEWDNNNRTNANYFQVRFICSNNHEFHMTYSNFKRGERCLHCRTNRILSYNDVRNSFSEKGYKLLTTSEDFINGTKTKLKYKCDKGHVNYIWWQNWYRGKGKFGSCLDCSGMKKILFSDIKKSFEDEDWIVLSIENDYKNQNETPIECICPNGHKQFKSVRKWRLGRRCPYCITSGPELKLRKFIDKLNIKYKPNYRKIGVELDIYLPSLNKAIEFNGDYWHCNPLKYDESYYNQHKGLYAYEIWKRDAMKKQVCEENNIQLLTVWEDEWNNNNKEVRSTIKVFLK